MSRIWLVVDGQCKGIAHDGPVLQCVFPGRDGYHEFSKDVGMLCHLEAWSLEELKKCRDGLGLPFTDAQLEERFYYWGGVPREIFDRSKSVEELKEMMFQAVNSAPSWEAVFRHAVGDADKTPLISDHLLHYKLPWDRMLEPYNRVGKFKLIFASAFVQNLVVDLYQQQEGFDAARNFFNFCQGSVLVPWTHDLSEKFFEKYVHRTLEGGGGDYKVKYLVAATGMPQSIMSLKPSSAKRLRRWEIVNEPSLQIQFSIYHKNTPIQAAQLGNEESIGLSHLPANCFVNPFFAIFESLDSFVTPDMMIQCTCSLAHKVFWAPVLEVLQEYDTWYLSRDQTLPDFYKLIFIVPESQFLLFEFQGYRKDDGSDYEKDSQPQMKRVRPFALSFPWREPHEEQSVRVHG